MLRPCTPFQLATIFATQRKGRSNVFSELVSFHQSGDSDLAYILLPPAGGSCASLNDLISKLSDRASILVLEHRNYIRPGNGFYSVEQLAAQFVAAIDSQNIDCTQYTFIGASFGGVVAVEIIRMMLSRSISLGFRLVLLDSPAPQVKGGAKILQDGSAKMETSVDRVVSDVQDENATALAGYQAATGMQDIDALYVAASSKSVEKSSQAESLWSTLLPQMKVERVEGDHMEIWRGRNAETTVSIMKEWHGGLSSQVTESERKTIADRACKHALG